MVLLFSGWNEQPGWRRRRTSSLCRTRRRAETDFLTRKKEMEESFLECTCFLFCSGGFKGKPKGNQKETKRKPKGNPACWGHVLRHQSYVQLAGFGWTDSKMSRGRRFCYNTDRNEQREATCACQPTTWPLLCWFPIQPLQTKSTRNKIRHARKQSTRFPSDGCAIRRVSPPMFSPFFCVFSSIFYVLGIGVGKLQGKAGMVKLERGI